MKRKLVSRTLTSSLVLGVAAILGCGSQPPALDPQAVDVAKKTVAQQDENISNIAKGKSGRYKGPLPKIGRGRVDIQGAGGQQ
jgi:hypothetical protein